MKAQMILGTLFALTSVAQAAPVICTTNINHDYRQISTEFSIVLTKDGQTQITYQTFGGLAHYVGAPETITVDVQNRGPELVDYSNTKADFDLTIAYQPVDGKIHGTYTGEIMDTKVQAPVTCVVFQN
jgi:hypothetical protein